MVTSIKDPDWWASDSSPLNQGRPVAALPSRLAMLAAIEEAQELTGPDDPKGFKPRPEELPEVAELIAEGWCPLAWFPPWAALPAVWPPQLRGWVPDRLPNVGIIGFGLRRHVEPAAWDHYREQVNFTRQTGLPAPPEGRLWLLRSPWPSVGVNVTVKLIWRRARELEVSSQPRAVRDAAEELLSWPEERLWSWWPDDEHVQIAREWNDREHVGNDVDDLVAAGIGPAAYRRLTDSRGAGLTRQQAVSWMRITRNNEEQVIALRARGLPADPPAGFFSHLALASVQELDQWTTAGYSIYEAFHLLGCPLDQALALSASGLEAPEVANTIQRQAVR